MQEKINATQVNPGSLPTPYTWSTVCLYCVVLSLLLWPTRPRFLHRHRPGPRKRAHAGIPGSHPKVARLHPGKWHSAASDLRHPATRDVRADSHGPVETGGATAGGKLEMRWGGQEKVAIYSRYK